MCVRCVCVRGVRLCVVCDATCDAGEYLEIGRYIQE